MNLQDRQRLVTNINWFNEFFEDLNTLLEKIAAAAMPALGLTEKGFYHYKSNILPYVPDYYMMGLGGKKYSIQVYAILDPGWIVPQPGLLAEPSFVVIKHPHGDRYLYVSLYGFKVLCNNQIESTSLRGHVISGKFTAGKNRGEHFQAFQVPFDSYIKGKKVDAVIQREFISVLKKLPALSSIKGKSVSK